MVLTSENRLDLRKKAMNFSDCRPMRRNRKNFAKIMIQETSEKKNRIARTTLAVGPVSLKNVRRESPAGRFSVRTGCQTANSIGLERNIRMGEGSKGMDAIRKGVSTSVRVTARTAAAVSLWGLLALGASAAPSPTKRPAPPEVKPGEILPIEKIAPGMKGYGVSDFGDGHGIQRFDVEILGLLRRYAPRQDLILARVSGAGLENSGIIAGMSGSPIYIDGKLVGALAYGWPFS